MDKVLEREFDNTRPTTACSDNEINNSDITLDEIKPYKNIKIIIALIFNIINIINV